MNTVVVRCEGANTLPLESFTEFQGELKSLQKQDYDKLKAQLLDPQIGFCEPINVWKTEGKFLIANGHQRIRTLSVMKKEGVSIPHIPVSWVFPNSIEEFAKIVLSLCAQYGKIEKAGMYEYCSTHNIPVQYLEERLRFPEIDLPKYKLEFFEEHQPASEDDQGQLDQTKQIECPECHHVFTP